MHEEIQNAKELFVSFLRENNLKVTRERLTLLEEIFTADDHVDADELLTRVKAKSRKVSRATVYRTLDLMVQCGLVRKGRFGRELYSYEKVEPGASHHHMVCSQTGDIIEFSDAEVDRRLRQLCGELGFIPTSISIQIKGVSKKASQSKQQE